MGASCGYGCCAGLLVVGLLAASSYAGPDSTQVSRRIPGSSLLVDHTGDGTITDTDVGVSALLQLEASPVTDLDGDGQVTASDRIATLELIILKSYGDVNGDGVVDIADMAQAAADASSTADPQSDANTDGVVDSNDVLFVAVSLGVSPPVGGGNLRDAASYLDRVVGQIESEGGADTFIGSEDGAGIGGSSIDHRRAISDSWYVPGSDHTRALSRLWPANHMYSISVTWDTYDHSIPVSKDEGWPAQHEGIFSRTWTTNPCPNCDQEHSYAISQSHPGEHLVERSELWSTAPGHLYSRSQTWPTDPAVHDPAFSGTWYPNHYYEISVDGGVSQHQYEYSWLNWPGDHAVNRSQDWPPSHTYRVSITWSPGHSDPWSFRWPPSHTVFVSATWDPSSYPRLWPPNHVRAQSEQDNMPDPWEETWPPGHTRWDSIRDILDLVPPFLPDQWWPLGGV